MKIQGNLKMVFLLLIMLTAINFGQAKTEPKLEKLDQFFDTILEWRNQQQMQIQSQDSKLKLTVPIMLAGALSFLAASISSAGGIGGGGLFLPILTVVAGLDLKTASSFSAFMVTGGSITNVACNMIIKGKKNVGKTLIDYDVALLSEPCMLLGTFKSGISYWKLESKGISRNGYQKLENGVSKNEILSDDKSGVLTIQTIEEPLLHKETSFKDDTPWLKMGKLIVIWFCFSILYLLREDRYGQGIITIETCGVGYWIISSSQIPLAIFFTLWILYGRKNRHNHAHQQELGSGTKDRGPDKFLFPIMALLAGGLGGLFGIGGGMLISPLLLQVGIAPEVTAATCSLMVFFSSTMSAFQYLLLGMNHVYAAIIFAVVCFVASLIGLVIVQRAIAKHGRASLIVFSVGIVMALSTVLITSFGAVDVWRDLNAGKYMGFKKPC